MADWQQLVYISRSAFAPSRQGLGVEPEVGRILVQSRLNNPRRGLVGALYYADGCFFQCLEGPSDALDALYDTLLGDARHRDLKLLYRRTIRAPSFQEWAMKYVPGAAEVRALLKKHGLRQFDPYRFKPEAVHDMVDLLQRGANRDAVPAHDAPTPSRRRKPSILMTVLMTLGLLAVAIGLGLMLR